MTLYNRKKGRLWVVVAVGRCCRGITKAAYPGDRLGESIWPSLFGPKLEVTTKIRAAASN